MIEPTPVETAAVLAGLVAGGVPPTTAANIAPTLLRGHAFIGATPDALREEARAWAQARRTGASDGAAWSLTKALRDSRYNEDWKKADPEGNRKAWREHLRRKAADPSYTPVT